MFGKDSCSKSLSSKIFKIIERQNSTKFPSKILVLRIQSALKYTLSAYIHHLHNYRAIKYLSSWSSKSRKFHDVYVELVIVKFGLNFQQQKGFFLQKLMRFRKEEIKKHRQKLYFYGFFDSILRSSSKYLIAISISIYFSR